VKFAKIVFGVAGIYGLLVLTPLYFLFDLVGQRQPPAITHPEYYFGFVGAGLAWQLAFLVIATDPVRYRLLILPSIFEKFSYAIAVYWLYAQGRVAAQAAGFASVDMALGILFVVCWVLLRKVRNAA
jgi:hypothetical protein